MLGKLEIVKQTIYAPEYISHKDGYQIDINIPIASPNNSPKMTILMAGSMRHYDWMKVCAAWLEAKGNWNVFLPIPKLPVYREHINDPEVHAKLIEQYDEKMTYADAMYVVNFPGRPIGEGTLDDIIRAKNSLLSIFYMTDSDIYHTHEGEKSPINFNEVNEYGN